MSWLDAFFVAYNSILSGGSALPGRQKLNFASGATVVDNPATLSTDVTIAGATGPGVAGGLVTGASFFGDGSDGTATCDGAATVAGMTLSGGNYTLNRDVFFATLTVNAGVAVNCAGWRIFVSGTLTCNGHVHADGGTPTGQFTSGAGGGGGYAEPTSRLAGGSVGGASGSSGQSITFAMGGRGGAGNVNSGGSFTAPAAQYSTPHELFAAIQGCVTGITGGTLMIIQYTGGSGGGSSGTGSGEPGQDQGSGGGGGGVAVVCPRVLAGSGHLSADGGNGYNTLTQGGGTLGSGTGGGGGGVFVLVYRDATAWSGTITANGGITGYSTGGAGHQPGNNGANGLVLQFQT